MAGKEKKETKKQGYIFLHRSIWDHWVWQDPVKFQWWVDILMVCNHSDQKVNIGFDILECKRGQSLFSLPTWSKRWRVDVSTVRRFLSLLQKDKMITIENVIKTTRITVCNYDDYNNVQHAKDMQNNGKAMARQTRGNTNNNDSNNEENNDKERIGEKEKSSKKINKLFRESEYFDKQALRQGLFGTKYEHADIDHYHEDITNWSDSKGEKKLDWLAAARNWMKRDLDSGKFKAEGQPNGKTTVINSKNAGATQLVAALRDEIESGA